MILEIHLFWYGDSNCKRFEKQKELKRMHANGQRSMHYAVVLLLRKQHTDAAPN